MSLEATTPLMKQFFGLKAEIPGALLFFRMGDFYELFSDDAVLASKILGITLTSRDRKSENPMPMAGVPFHSAQNYIQKLLNAGKKVAIAEQFLPPGVESFDQVKGIAERKIVRVFTPAVQFEMTENSESKFLATLLPHITVSKTNSKNEPEFILSLFDPATGVIKISNPMNVGEVLSTPLLSSVKHFLNASSKTPLEIIQYFESLAATKNTLVEEIAHNAVADSETLSFLQKQYQKQVLHPLLALPAAQKGVSLLVHYTLKTQGLETLPHLHEPKALFETNRLVTGPNTHDHLDTQDLFQLINHTSTSMGARALRQQLEAPFKVLSEIHERQNAIQEMAASLRSPQIQTHLKEVYDLDRILGRVSTKLANPRDTYSLGKSLRAVFDVIPKASELKSPLTKKLSAMIEHAHVALETITERILKTQIPEAPFHTRDGGIFTVGTDPTLDHLIMLSQNGERFIIDLETREREATGIGSLKVKYNRVFGYFIEISSANLAKVPTHYQRKQTMVGGERFFTEELKKFEEEVLTAAQKQKALEQELFQKLILDLVKLAEPLKQVAEAVGEVDALLSLSLLAQKGSWCFPIIDDSHDFSLKNSRHPVVDAALNGKFVSNHVEFNETTRTLIITGPNMGGKSTVMRQFAQLILLGQMGAPIPASEARFGIFHSLFTRIGAHDAIAKGQSTFMVEMVELAHILSHADSRSFVVLDEIGRGTSTYDGMSVASSSLKYLHQKSGARIVFATHYHELTSLEEELGGIQNLHMKVTDENNKLTFLYELVKGRSSKSFGIQVAELAGIPKAVIKDAWKVLKELEEKNSERVATHARASHPDQLSLFQIAPPDESETRTHEALPGLTASLKELNLNELRPLDALNLLAEWQGLIK